MTEYAFVTDIVKLISNHWEVFKWFFYGLAIKYLGEGAFNVGKVFIAIAMGWKEIRGK